MLYLITGANGAGKTLNALKWVRERQVKENRPVFHNGRFEPVAGGELASWQAIDIKDWQSQPDGAIFFVDECHNDFPVRAASSPPPDYVKALAEHRRRGFDFYLITQHPQNIDSFVRRLIGTPGWHRHLKRVFGAEVVSVLEWSSVNPNCEKAGSGSTAQVFMSRFPTEVFGWYKSASLHTAKKRIPKAVWLLAGAAVVVPALGYFAYSRLPGTAAPTTSSGARGVSAVSAPVAVASPSEPPAKASVAEYVSLRVPRVPGLPQTAPVYDEVTRPVDAPFPAACISMGPRCECFTQQATRINVPLELCRQIVAGGLFIDWRRHEPVQSEKLDERRSGDAERRPDDAERRSGDAHARSEDPLSAGQKRDLEASEPKQTDFVAQAVTPASR